MNDNTTGPDGLRDDERAKPWDLSIAAPHCVCADCTVITLRARLIESRAETEAARTEIEKLRAEVAAYARTMADRTVDWSTDLAHTQDELAAEKDANREAFDVLAATTKSLEAEKAAHAETRAERDQLSHAVVAYSPGSIRGPAAISGARGAFRINWVHYPVTKTKMTGAELRRVPSDHIQQSHDLWLICPGYPDRKISDTETVEIGNGVRLFSVPSVINQGSPEKDAMTTTIEALTKAEEQLP
jgi:hypothetical protein